MGLSMYAPIYRIQNKKELTRFINDFLSLVYSRVCEKTKKKVELGFGVKDNFLFISPNVFLDENKYYLLYLIPILEEKGIIKIVSFLNMENLKIVPLESELGQVLLKLFNTIKKAGIKDYYMLIEDSSSRESLNPLTYNKPFRTLDRDSRSVNYPIGIGVPEVKMTLPDRQIVSVKTFPIDKLNNTFFKMFKNGDLSWRSDDKCSSYLQVNYKSSMTLFFIVKDGEFYWLNHKGFDDPYLYWMQFFDIEMSKYLNNEEANVYWDYIRVKLRRKPYITRVAVAPGMFFTSGFVYELGKDYVIAKDYKQRLKVNLFKELDNAEFKVVEKKTLHKIPVLLATILGVAGLNKESIIPERANTTSIVDFLNMEIDYKGELEWFKGIFVKVGLPDGNKLKPVWYPIWALLKQGDHSMVVYHKSLMYLYLLHVIIKAFYLNDLSVFKKVPKFMKFNVSVEDFENFRRSDINFNLSLPGLTFNCKSSLYYEGWYVKDTHSWSLDYKREGDVRHHLDYEGRGFNKGAELIVKLPGNINPREYSKELLSKARKLSNLLNKAS